MLVLGTPFEKRFLFVCVFGAREGSFYKAVPGIYELRISLDRSNILKAFRLRS